MAPGILAEVAQGLGHQGERRTLSRHGGRGFWLSRQHRHPAETRQGRRKTAGGCSQSLVEKRPTQRSLTQGVTSAASGLSWALPTWKLMLRVQNPLHQPGRPWPPARGSAPAVLFPASTSARSLEGEPPGPTARPPGWHAGVCGCQSCSCFSLLGMTPRPLSCLSLPGTPPKLEPDKSCQAAVRAQNGFPSQAASDLLFLLPLGTGAQTHNGILTRSFKLSLKWLRSHFLSHRMKGQYGLDGIIRKCGHAWSSIQKVPGVH